MGIPGYLPGYRSHVPYIYARALDLSAKIRMHEIELVTRKWRRILQKLPDLTKSPSERYKLSEDHVRPVSKRLCIIFMACSCPNFVLGHLKKKKKRKKKKKKKKMEKIAFFPFSVYNSAMYFRQFVSVIGYIVTHTRWSDT